MGILSWLFDDPRPADELGDLREGLAALVKRAMHDGDCLNLKIWNCSIRDMPVGSWHIVVQRIPDEKQRGTKS